MSKYTKVDSSLNFVAREKQILEFWKENKIFEQTAAKGEGSFTFYDGPPTAMFSPVRSRTLFRVIR